MRRVIAIIRKLVQGTSEPVLEEETYPRDKMGRPDLQRFTKSAAHYAAYIDEYVDSLGPTGPADPRAQVLAYRKSVLGQWGLIARGPTEALPDVLRLINSTVPEGRSAAAAVLDAWAKDAVLVPHLIGALEVETDIETLSTLAGTLGRLRAVEALPRLAELLRSPDSVVGDLRWSVIEALSAIARVPFTSAAEPAQAADEWLRGRGY